MKSSNHFSKEDKYYSIWLNPPEKIEKYNYKMRFFHFSKTHSKVILISFRRHCS